PYRGRRHSEDHIDVHANELGRQRGHAIEPAFAPANLDLDVLALDVPEVAKPLAEIFQERRGTVLRCDRLQVTDPRDLCGLGERRERSRQRERTERDRKLSAGHHGFSGEALAGRVDSTARTWARSRRRPAKSVARAKPPCHQRAEPRITVVERNGGERYV